MRTVTLEVSSREETNRRFLRAFEGESHGEIISFETPALLFKVLTQKRWHPSEDGGKSDRVPV